MKEGVNIPPGWVKDEVREAIRSLEKDLVQRTRKFEDDTGLAVMSLNLHRTGASDDPADSVSSVGITLAYKYCPSRAGGED